MPFSDPQAVGGIILEDASGNVVTSGSLSDDPTFPMAVGNNPATRATDNSAVLNIATPTANQTPVNYYSDQLQPASNYTAGTAPTNVGSTGGGLTLGQYIGLDNGRNPSTDSYANLYELRLVPGTNGVGADATYYTAVISVTEGAAASDGSATGTWTLISTATNTVLSASPANSSNTGTSVTLSATTTPAAAGTVTFKEGSKTLGTATTNASTGVATLATTFASGTHKVISSYVPTVPTSVDPSTSQTLTYTSNVISTSTSIAASPASPSTFGAAVTLTSTTTAGSAFPAGTVVFKDGTTVLNSTAAAVSTTNGQASYTIPAPGPAVGNHSYTATYTATDPTTYAPSTSSAITYVVIPAAVTPPASLPEAPYALLLPILGGTLGAVIVVRRRARV